MGCSCAPWAVVGGLVLALAGMPDARGQVAGSAEVPEGLSAADWSGIRAAHEAFRRAAVPVEGGYRTRHAGQRWAMRFDGRGLPARFEEVSEGLLLTIDDRGARYPLTIAPIAQQGGVMVPSNDWVIPNLIVGTDGSLVLENRWPAGTPSGFQMYFQYWIVDAAGPQGWAASNAVSGTTP